MAVPYVFSGVVVSLALTRSPFPTGQVYGVDLIGRGTGMRRGARHPEFSGRPDGHCCLRAVSALSALAFAASADARQTAS